MTNTFKVGDAVELTGKNAAHVAIFWEEAGPGPHRVARVGLGGRIDVRGPVGRLSTGWDPGCFRRVPPSAPDAAKPADDTLKVGDIVEVVETNPKLDALRKPLAVTSVNSMFVSVIDANGVESFGWFPSRFKRIVSAPAAAPEATPKATKTFIVAVLKDGVPAPSTTPKVYTSRSQAETVSRIMAEKHLGETFVVFEAVAASTLPRKSAVTISL